MIEAIQAVHLVETTTGRDAVAAQGQISPFGAFIDRMEQGEVDTQNKLAAYLDGSSSVPVHEIMLDIERNRLMLSLTLQIRNKIVEGVQELYRTPI